MKSGRTKLNNENKVVLLRKSKLNGQFPNTHPMDTLRTHHLAQRAHGLLNVGFFILLTLMNFGDIPSI